MIDKWEIAYQWGDKVNTQKLKRRHSVTNIKYCNIYNECLPYIYSAKIWWWKTGAEQ